MGNSACGGKHCVDDGAVAADGDYIAAVELWWDEYVVHGGGDRDSFATVVLHEQRAKK